MATTWQTGMKLTPARLNSGSSITWTTGMVVNAVRWAEAYGKTVTAGDPAAPERLNA